jgi:thiol-disulfide isomerase/thioredoxin
MTGLHVKKRIPGLALTILAAALASCGRAADGDKTPIATPAPPPAATQPTAQLDRADLDGLRHLIAETRERNQVLVLDFWATWCPPCVEMFPILHQRIAALGSGVRLVTITLDDNDTEAAAIRFLDDHHARQDAYMLTPQTDARFRAIAGIARQWKDLVVPAILIYDRGGNLDSELVTDPRVEAVLSRVRELLAPQPVVNQP